MDINATMRRLLAAACEGHRGEAQELALAVRGWLSRGGFPPIGYTTAQALAVTQRFA